MKKYWTVLFILISLMLNSCEFLLPCLDGNGDLETEERIGGVFTGIEAEGEFDVRVEYAPTTSVEVTTDKNLMEYIETTVKNGKLTISTNHKGCINYSSSTEVLVRCPNITNVSLLGSGNLEVYNFNGDYFYVTQAGSGEITISSVSVTNDIDVNLIGSGNVWLKGRAQKAIYNLAGSGNIDSEAMRVYDGIITLSGSGNIHTYVYDVLKVTMSGSGSVYYYGNPNDVIIHNTGSGDVVNRSYDGGN